MSVDWTKYPLNLSLFFVSVLIAVFCSGCCSCMVWQETGKVTTHVEETRADFTRPGELTLRMTGWQEKSWLPWQSPTGHGPWEETVTLPLDRLPEGKTGGEKTYHLSTCASRFFKTESGVWSMPKWERDIHPDDIRHLSEPFIDAFWGPSEQWLVIPSEVRESEDEYGKKVICIKWAHRHIFHNPGDSFSGDIEGVGITVWRCCLMPVPIACDIATFPLQLLTFYTLVLYGGWRI